MSEEAVCSNCDGERWVCENHDNEPWDGDPKCCGGAGVPCPVCNDVGPGEVPEFPPGVTIIWSAFSDNTLH